MIKIVHNFNKKKYLIGSFIIIIIPIILLFIHFKKRDVYLYYDTNITYCKDLNEYEKSRYLICYNKEEYSFKVKDKYNIRLVDNLKNIKITRIDDFFSNYRRNKRIFLVVKKGNKYEVLPVKMFEVISRTYYEELILEENN